MVREHEGSRSANADLLLARVRLSRVLHKRDEQKLRDAAAFLDYITDRLEGVAQPDSTAEADPASVPCNTPERRSSEMKWAKRLAVLLAAGAVLGTLWHKHNDRMFKKLDADLVADLGE